MFFITFSTQYKATMIYGWSNRQNSKTMEWVNEVTSTLSGSCLKWFHYDGNSGHSISSTFPAALCFTELRESVRKEGVEYAYISEAFGPVTAFVYCWMRIAAAEPVGTAVFCAAFADYTADAIYDGCGPPDTIRKSLAILALGKFILKAM